MKRLFYKIIISTFLMFSYSSCNLNNEPLQKENYSVLINFISNSSHQKIYIYKTLMPNESVRKFIENNTINNWVCTNALIQISQNSTIFEDFSIAIDTIKNRIKSIEKFYTNNSNLQITPNTKYYLKIETDNIIITGSTIVPGDFQLQSPLENQTFHYNNDFDSSVVIPIKWTKSSNVSGYIVNVDYYDEFNFNYDRVLSYTSSNKETKFNYIQNFGSSYNTKGRFRIEVLAFDKNYYSHVIKNLPSAGLNGAYGYFGSTVLKTVTIYIE